MAQTFDLPQMGRDKIAEQITALDLPAANVDLAWDDAEMGSRSTRMVLDTQTGAFETFVTPSEQDLRRLGDMALDS